MKLGRRNFLKTAIGAALFIPASRLEFGVPKQKLIVPSSIVAIDLSEPSKDWTVASWSYPGYTDTEGGLSFFSNIIKGDIQVRIDQEVDPVLRSNQSYWKRRPDGMFVPIYANKYDQAQDS